MQARRGEKQSAGPMVMIALLNVLLLAVIWAALVVR
jgi:hypothetical protein